SRWLRALGIDKVDAPEENEESFSSDCKFSCALNSARAENLSGMKIPSRPGKRAFGNFLLGDVHAVACGLKMKGLRPLHASQVLTIGLLMVAKYLLGE
ncbi:MAG: hypothetical protein IJ664_02900, partial [Clostridia bacterium]|nr:hypothetical protein [Clostridia bacterium]